MGASSETVTTLRHRDLTRREVRFDRSRFVRVVAPMAPWVFAAPAVAFALLPSVVGADQATDGTAVVAAVTALCALAGVAVQPLARRLDARLGTRRAAPVGLIVLTAGLALSAATVAIDRIWLLFPCAVVLGAAYGLCLVAGLVQVQRLAPAGGLARLTAVFYVLTYLGFAAPYLLALGAHLAGYPTLLSITAGLALLTAAAVHLEAGRRSTDPLERLRRRRDDHLNEGQPMTTLPRPTGYLHAGTAVTLTDTACGYGCLASLPPGKSGFTTLELKTNHLATARVGQRLHVVATPIHHGGATQVWDAVVTAGTPDDHAETPRIAVFRCTQADAARTSRSQTTAAGNQR
jgi:uncharacterized protein (TIGR00369 family)